MMPSRGMGALRSSKIPKMKDGGSTSRVNEAGNYTKPGMRKGLFNKIKAGGKGGAPGQWSARKAQMLAPAIQKSRWRLQGLIMYTGDQDSVGGREFTGLDEEGNPIYGKAPKPEAGKSFNDAIKDLFWDVLGREPRPEELSAYKRDLVQKLILVKRRFSLSVRNKKFKIATIQF
jgi:hypothetical protein